MFVNVPYLGGIGSGPSNHYNPPQDSVLNAWANMNLCTVSNDTIIDNMQYTFIKWTSCDYGSEIHHYATQDGGHSWPGGVQTPTGDSTSIYINATDLMWSFFQQYSLDCGITSSVGSYLNKNHNFNLFPNPSTGIINVENPELIEDFIITVYDHFGKTILKSKNIDVINITNQLPGFYYITIQTEDQIMTEKIIKVE
ncbi:unnamed protein product [marine sediment metagenome]|uniref:Secretion system C-terminal sorting domain-containing protein n=1 Tax=marine sediment metagenome TaxID=412755 RepID=X1I6J3_9ZZZZ